MAIQQAERGFKNFHYCLRTSAGASAPVPLHGAVKLSFNPQVESRTVLKRTDKGGIVKFTESARETAKSASLEIISLPRIFLTEVLGYTEDENGVLIEGEYEAKHISLLYESQSGDSAVRHELIDVIVSKPSFDVSTLAGSLSADTKKLELTVNRDLESGGFSKSIKRDVNPEIFDNWFNRVY
jgi:hypothetical protein